MNAVVNTTPVTQVFHTAFAAAESIDYNPSWANGTGYYNGAVRGDSAPKLAVGQIVSAHSPLPNDRQILIIGTPLGNLVVFQRYSGGDSDVYAFNSTAAFNRYFGSRLNRPLSVDDMEWLVGNAKYPSICPNIGTRIAELSAAIAAFNPSSDVNDVQ